MSTQIEQFCGQIKWSGPGNPVTYWPSTFFKIKLRLVAVDLGQVTGFGFGSHVGMGLRSNSGLVVSRTPSATTTNTARLESRGLSRSRRLYTRPRKDILRWVNVSRTIQKV